MADTRRDFLLRFAAIALAAGFPLGDAAAQSWPATKVLYGPPARRDHDDDHRERPEREAEERDRPPSRDRDRDERDSERHQHDDEREDRHRAKE